MPSRAPVYIKRRLCGTGAPRVCARRGGAFLKSGKQAHDAMILINPILIMLSDTNKDRSREQYRFPTTITPTGFGETGLYLCMKRTDGGGSNKSLKKNYKSSSPTGFGHRQRLQVSERTDRVGTCGNQ